MQPDCRFLLLALLASCLRATADEPRSSHLTPDKSTVQKYMQAFGKSDHAAILDCLTDDVEWIIPGHVHLRGKAAFDREIENEAFVGSPKIQVTRLIEENQIVVAEGSVQSARKAGGELNARFCDVFEMDGGKIKRLTSYLLELK